LRLASFLSCVALFSISSPPFSVLFVATTTTVAGDAFDVPFFLLF